MSSQLGYLYSKRQTSQEEACRFTKRSTTQHKGLGKRRLVCAKPRIQCLAPQKCAGSQPKELEELMRKRWAVIEREPEHGQCDLMVINWRKLGKIILASSLNPCTVFLAFKCEEHVPLPGLRTFRGRSSIPSWRAKTGRLGEVRVALLLLCFQM